MYGKMLIEVVATLLSMTKHFDTLYTAYTDLDAYHLVHWHRPWWIRCNLSGMLQ